jgi:general nucleoside transport system permease protein
MGDFVEIFGSTLRLATPLIFAALGGFLSERSGVVNIALEGFLLVGAFAAAAVALASGSAPLGLLAAALAGALLALLYGVFAVYLNGNQIVAGTAINMLAFALLPLISKALYDATGSTPSIPIEARFSIAPVWIAIGLALVFWLVFRYLRVGLWISFAGEHPEALQSAGVRVKPFRLLMVTASGFFAGMGGATLSIFLSSAYTRNMSAGRGFIALAALILGKWHPLGALVACLFFGLAEALQTRFQGMVLWGTEPVPVILVQILPYVVTLVILGGFVGRSRAPAAIGREFQNS